MRKPGIKETRKIIIRAAGKQEGYFLLLKYGLFSTRNIISYNMNMNFGLCG
jgi:hypothetical protein